MHVHACIPKVKLFVSACVGTFHSAFWSLAKQQHVLVVSTHRLVKRQAEVLQPNASTREVKKIDPDKE